MVLSCTRELNFALFKRRKTGFFQKVENMKIELPCTRELNFPVFFQKFLKNILALETSVLEGCLSSNACFSKKWLKKNLDFEGKKDLQRRSKNRGKFKFFFSFFWGAFLHSFWHRDPHFWRMSQAKLLFSGRPFFGFWRKMAPKRESIWSQKEAPNFKDFWGEKREEKIEKVYLPRPWRKSDLGVPSLA